MHNPPSKRTHAWAKINKNFLNFPLARDTRVALAWRQSERTGNWLCDMPGDDRVQLRLPPDTPRDERRWPSPFDMNVLFYVLGEAQEQKRSSPQLGSNALILRRLGYSATTRNVRKLKSALKFWTMASIRFDNWHEPKAGAIGYGRKVYRVLPPPLRFVRSSPVVNDEWSAMVKRYFKGYVRLPLPQLAGAQNLELMLLAMDGIGERTVNVRRLCRKLGLNHKLRRPSFKHALKLVASHCLAQDKMFDWDFSDDGKHIKLSVRSWAQLSKAAARYEANEELDDSELILGEGL